MGAAALGLALAASWAVSAWAGPADWSVTADKEFTNVPAGSHGFQDLVARDSPSNRGTHRLTVRMPKRNQPSTRAVVTIERSFTSVKEGDHVTLSFSGDPNEVHAKPPPEVAVYVHCTFEDEAGEEKKKAWVRLEIADVEPTTHVHTLHGVVKGSGCADTVDLGVSREIDGARIQLRGAVDKHDHRRRTVYLYEFKLFETTGENNPAIWDDFTKAK
jgi:hypothetical protein